MNSIKIGLLGCGTVGCGTYHILKNRATHIENLVGVKAEIVKIFDRDICRVREGIDQDLFTDAVQDVLDDPDISIVIEVIGGVDDAYTYIKRALQNKKSVVTANKDLLSLHGLELLTIAQKNNRDLMYEASVCGGIPIIGSLKRSLQANRFTRIMGILNGTTNYILTKMYQENLEYQDVLAEAQALGYAEADPTGDVEGLDAARKLAILSSLAFKCNVTLDDVHCEGISKISKQDIAYAKEFGYVIKLLGAAECENNQLDTKVFPALVPTSHPIASVNDVFNCVYLVGDSVGEVMLYGKGAGACPTGSAVVGDVIEVLQNIHTKSKNHAYPLYVDEVQHHSHLNSHARFYLRLTVKDQCGTLAHYTSILAKYQISVKSITQNKWDNQSAEIVIITQLVKERNMSDCLAELADVDVVHSIESVLRVIE